MNRLKRRIVSGALVLSMLATMLPMSAFAAEGGEPLTEVEPLSLEGTLQQDSTEDKIQSNGETGTDSPYVLSETEVAYSAEGGNLYFDTATGVITGCDKEVTKAVIPDTIEEVSVISVGNSAFRDCNNLTAITLPDSVTSIGEYAFYGCDSLPSVKIPDSVTSIGDRAFAYSGLVSVIIPDSVASIGIYVFADCEDLSCATIGDGLSSIANRMFYSCDNLTSVTIGAGVTYFERFEDCFNLKEINVVSQNSAFCSLDGVLFNKEMTTIIEYPDGRQGGYTIPNGVLTVGYQSFSSCFGLTSVIIPDSVTSIGRDAFRFCNSLTNMTIPDSVISIGEDAFRSCTSLISVEIPDSVTSIGDRVFYSCTSLTSVEIPDSVTSIGESAFRSCNGLTDMIIPDSVISIGEDAFRSCTSLTSMEIPDSVTSMGERVFYSCTGLTSVEISDSVTSIGEGAFYFCNSLVSVTMGNDVTFIGRNAFFDCDSLANIYYGGSEDKWDAIWIESGNWSLSGATIHYNSTKPDEPEVDQPEASIGSVEFFSKWDSDTKQAYFDYSALAYSVTDNTEISPNQSIDQLVGKYVLVKMNESSPLEIFSIKPVDSRIGTVTDVIVGNGNPAVTSLQFEDGTYAVVNGLIVSEGIIGKQVLYHLLSEEIVGYTELQKKTGTLEKWDNTTGGATISGTNYATNFLSTLPLYIDNLVGKPVQLLVDNKPGGISTILELSFEPGFYFSTNAVSNSLEVGMSSELYVNYYQEDGSVDPGLNSFAFVVSNDDIIDVKPQDWNAKLGQHFTITAKKAGLSTITITNPQNNKAKNIQINAIEKREGYTFKNVPKLVYEEGNITNFYNHNGMVIDEFNYVPHHDTNGNIDYYTVTMTVYNSLNLYGTVTAFNAEGVATDVDVIDRKTTMPSNFFGTCLDLFEETGDLFYLFGNEYYYSGESVSQATDISVRVPANGYLEISNSASSSTAVLANFIGLLIDGSAAAVDIGTSADDFIKSKPTIIYNIIQKNFIEESVADAAVDAALNQLKFPNWNNENYGDCMHAFVDQLSDYGIDLINMISDEIVLVTGIYSITESILMEVIPTGKLITFLYDVLGIEDQIVAWSTFQRSASFADGIYIYAPTNGDSYISNGVSVTPDSGIGTDVITHVYFVTDDEEAGITNNTFPNEETYLSGSYKTYNITMYKNGQETQPEGYVTVKIPLPDSFSTFDKNKIKVYRLNNDGTTTDMSAEITGEYAVFRTDHFSYYSIVYEGNISENIPVKDILLNTQQHEFNQAGNIYQLVATIMPANATNKAVTWVSSNPSVATVTDAGLVTAVSNGVTTITATTQDGGYTATCEVRVELTEDPNVPVTGVELNTQRITLSQIGNTYQLEADVTPINATNQAVSWASSTPSVATVSDNGLVTAVSEGTTTITVTTEDGQKVATCTVTVRIESGSGGTGGGGSSGSTTPASYTITSEYTVGGAITISPKTASKGQTVTITAVPDDGFALKTLSVTDKNGNKIELTKQTETSYTFKMPASKVTVSATFTEIVVEPEPIILPFDDISQSAWYYGAVEYVYSNDMMQGTSATRFSPEVEMSRGMIATVLYRLENTPALTGSTSFSDVGGNEWYTDAIQWAAENNIMSGYGNNRFGPMDSVTREQLAVILYNYTASNGISVEAAGDLSVFHDAEDTSDWAEEAISWAVGVGLLSGKGNGILDPTGTATRAEVAQILMNYCTKVA